MRTPNKFWLFEGVEEGLELNISYSYTPENINVNEYTTGVKSVLKSIYSGAIIQYMLYLAHSKDFEYSEQQKATQHLNAFNMAMDNKFQSDTSSTPLKEV